MGRTYISKCVATFRMFLFNCVCMCVRARGCCALFQDVKKLKHHAQKNKFWFEGGDIVPIAR